MGIEQIKGIGPATMKKLDAAGVRTLADVRAMDTESIEKRTGIQRRRLDQWRMEARMMKVIDDVKGIGPATKRRLQQAGIHSLEDLARESAHQVAVQARVAKDRAAAWQKEAKRLLEQTQGRFHEERDKAVKQGRKLAKQASRTADTAGKRARKTARQGRNATDDLIERVRGTTGSGDEISAQGAQETGETRSQTQTDAPDGPQVPGNNGDTAGLLTRLRRFFQPRP